MTLTLEISPEVELELTRAAAQAGRGLSEWILDMAREKAARSQHEDDEAEARRLEAADRAFGMFAGDGRTVDDFLADRHAEGEAEYDKWMESQKRDAQHPKGESA